MSLIKPATLDLASFIGAALARPHLDRSKRTLYHRIWSHLPADAHKRVCQAYADAMRDGDLCAH